MSFNFGNANEAQQKAITHTEGPLLIIAGPGTGKTSTLVNRILYLITEKNVEPQEIMVVTYTDKAAKELITRVSDKLPDINVNEMYIGTFHSVFLNIIENYLEYTKIRKNYRLLDGFDQNYFICQHFQRFKNTPYYEELGITKDFKGRSQNKWKQSKKIATYINSVREELVDIEELEKAEDHHLIEIAKLLETYEEIMSEENVIDFSAILLESYKLFQNHPEVLKELQKKISYIMVDEYQDSNYIQEQLVLLLAGNKKNLCVVGDDDQALYRFRGATVSNILNFSKHFSKDEFYSVELSTNYRSAKSIVDFYTNWMSEKAPFTINFSWGNDRLPKKLTARDDAATDLRVVRCSSKNDDTDWYKSIYHFIRKLKENNVITNYNQVAFLVRNVKVGNKQIYGGLIKYLEEHDIPVYAPRFGMYFERPEVMQLLGCLISCFPVYLHNLKNNELKYMQSGLADYYKDCVKAAEKCFAADSCLKTWITNIQNKHRSLSQNTDYAFSSLLYQLLAFEPFHSHIGVDLGKGVANERAARNISYLINYACKYENSRMISVFVPNTFEKTVEDFLTFYLGYLKSDGINEFEDNSEYAPDNCISFMTIHQSKGMEFPVVIVDSLDNTPYLFEDSIITKLEDYYIRNLSESKNNIMNYDFCRLYYTAFSRAQNLLVLTCPDNKVSESFKDDYFQLTPYEDVDLSSIPFCEVKPVHIKETYSFTSHIGLYENCPLQYKFFKELAFSPVRNQATLFGTLVHETIEDVHKAVLRGEENLVTDDHIQNWLNTNYITLSKTEHAYLAQKQLLAAYHQVLKYVKKACSDWSRIKEAEFEVSHSEPDYILLGKVDLIRGDDSNYELVDFKSEKKEDLSQNHDRLERYRKQLQVYAHIIQEKRDVTINKAHLYCTGDNSDNPQITFELTEESINNTIEEFDQVVHKIQKKILVVVLLIKSFAKNVI